MERNQLPLSCTATVALLALACLGSPALTADSPLDVRVVYEGAGQVDEDHGLALFVFNDSDLSNPTTSILAARYLTKNGAMARFADLGTDPVWLVAIYDEVGGFSSGPLLGPFGVFSNTPDGAPTGVRLDGEGVELRFDDSNRQPVPEATKPKASFKTLKEAKDGIVEIRIYRIKPGLRDEFVRFFEDGLEAQAKAGLRVRGHFRSLDEENTFVWIRTFRNQKERQERSRAFYLSPEWLGKRNPEAVRFLESAEVMLLEPTAQSGIR